MVTTLDVGFLGLTVVWGLVFVVYAGNAYSKGQRIQNIMWILATLALLVVGATILFYDFAGLGMYHTPVTGMFIPGLFAAGILAAAYRRKYGLYWAAYVLVLTLVYAGLRVMSLDLPFSPYLPNVLAIHVPSGLIIILVPAIAAARKSSTLALTSIGGILIGIIGLALATIAVEAPILPADLALTIVTPVIFLGTLFITLGLMLTRSWLGIE